MLLYCAYIPPQLVWQPGRAVAIVMWHLQYFAVGTITAANVIGFASVMTGLISYFDDTMGRQSLRQPWSTPDVGPQLLFVA